MKALDLSLLTATYKRFPFGVVSSLMTALVLVLSSFTNKENLIPIAGAGVLALVLFVCIDLLSESIKISKLNKLFLYFFGLTIVILTYLFLLRDFNFVNYTRFIGMVLFFFIAAFFVGRIKNHSHLENYIFKLLLGILNSIFFSSVLFIGFGAIFFSVSSLFDIQLSGNLMENTFIIVIFLFGIPYFMSRIPRRDEEETNYQYPKVIKILISYIVIPLLLLYVLVLYIYFTRILLSWQWPIGIVGNLSIWYSLLSLLVFFFVRPIKSEGGTLSLYSRILPIINIPILLMMFLSLYQRISQYGITENRYFVLVAGIWLLTVFILLVINKNLRSIIIPISLMIAIAISIYGPVSAYSISKWSQNNRLENILVSNNMLLDEKIIPNQNLDKPLQDEVYEIVNYFQSNHSLSDIKHLRKGVAPCELIGIFGFSDRDIKEDYTLINIDRKEEVSEVISIEDYDYLINIDSGKRHDYKNDDLIFEFNPFNFMLKISRDDEIIYNENINSIVDNFIDNREDASMVFQDENNALRLKFIFNSIQGKNYTNGDLEIDWVDLSILLKIK